MSTSGSSLRSLGLGSLFKIGGIATVTYFLLRQIKERRAADKARQQKTVRSYRHSISPGEKTRVQKVKVESPSPYASGIITDNSNDLKVNIIQTGANEYNASMGNMHLDRESPAHLLADIKEPETMQVLDETLSSPPPAEDPDQPENLSTEGIGAESFSAERDELKEKLAAIEAIGCMAAGGNPKALNLLFKHVRNESFLVRHEAIRGILQYGGREDRELLKETLPAGDWYVMDIRPEDMRKVC